MQVKFTFKILGEKKMVQFFLALIYEIKYLCAHSTVVAFFIHIYMKIQYCSVI